MTTSAPGGSAAILDPPGIPATLEGDRDPVQLSFTASSKIAWLQEIGFTMTKLLILLTTVLVIGLSINVKASWLAILLRAGVTIFVLGLAGWFVNLVFGKILVDIKYSELAEAKTSLEGDNPQKVEYHA
jgi:hypothetical protein